MINPEFNGDFVEVGSVCLTFFGQKVQGHIFSELHRIKLRVMAQNLWI